MQSESNGSSRSTVRSIGIAGSVGSGNAPGGNLVEQGLEEVEIAPIDQSEFDRGAAQVFGGVQAGETAAEHHHLIALPRRNALHAAHCACKRLDHRRALRGEADGHRQEVARHDRRGHAQVFGVRAGEVGDLLAQRWTPHRTWWACATWGRVRRHDEVALANALREWPNGGMKFPKQDIRNPADFQQMARLVRPEDFSGRMLISSDLEAHRTAIQRYLDMGFDKIYLHNVGRNQVEWAEAFGREVLPGLTA